MPPESMRARVMEPHRAVGVTWVGEPLPKPARPHTRPLLKNQNALFLWAPLATPKLFRHQRRLETSPHPPLHAGVTLAVTLGSKSALEVGSLLSATGLCRNHDGVK